MKMIYFLLIAYTLQNVSVKCFFYFEKQFAIYNIKDLFLAEKEPYQIKDYEYKGNKGVLKGTLFVNICDKVPVPDFCEKGTPDSSVLLVNEEQKKCLSLIKSSGSRNISEYTLIDEKKPLNGFFIDKSEDFNVEIACQEDSKQTVPSYRVMKDNNLEIKSLDSCGIENEVARAIANNKVLASLLLILLGMVFLLYGGSKWDSILTIVGFLAGFGSILFIFWAFVDVQPKTSSYIIIIVIAIIVGVLIASLCHTFVILSYFLLGLGAGVLLSKYILVLAKFQGENWQVLLIVISSGVVLGLICMYVQNYLLAILTAIIGAFLVTYFFGFMIGILGNFFDVIERIKAGEKLEPAYYVFLGLFILVSIFGVYFQFKTIKGKKDDSDYLRDERLLQI